MRPSRRAVLAGGLGLGASRPAWAQADAQAQTGGPQALILIERGLKWLGGGPVVEARPVLTWTGTATVHAADPPIQIGIETTVDPFRAARSDSWPTAEGRAATRSLIVDGAGAWVERGGDRTALTEAAAVHERQQYALYALMRLSGLRPDQVIWLAPDADGREGLEIRHGLAPTTAFRFDPDGRIASAENAVADPQGGAEPIVQRFVFDGDIEGGGVRWFRTMRLAQNGRPEFDLTIERFEAQARA